MDQSNCYAARATTDDCDDDAGDDGAAAAATDNTVITARFIQQLKIRIGERLRADRERLD